MSKSCSSGGKHKLNKAGYACELCGMSAEYLPKDVAKLSR